MSNNNILLNNYDTTKVYSKPKLTVIDTDFINTNLTIEELYNIVPAIPQFRAIVQKNYDYLKNIYCKSPYIIFNLNKQTPLMLAAKLKDYTAIEILKCKDAGRCDSHGIIAKNLLDDEMKYLLDSKE